MVTRVHFEDNFFLASEAQEFSSFHNIHRWCLFQHWWQTCFFKRYFWRCVFGVRNYNRCNHLVLSQFNIRCLFTPSCCPDDHCRTFLSWTKFFETLFIHAYCEQYPCKFRKHDTVLIDTFWEVIRTYCIIIKDEKLSYFSGNHLIARSSSLPLLLGCVLHTLLRKRPFFHFPHGSSPNLGH